MNQKFLCCLALATALITNLVSCTEGSLVGINGKRTGIITCRGFRPLSGQTDLPAYSGERSRSVLNIENAVLVGIEETFSHCANFQYVPFRQLRYQPEPIGEILYPLDFKRFACANNLDLALGTTITVVPGAGQVHLSLLVRDVNGKNVGFALASAKGNFPPSNIWGTTYLGEQFLPIWRQAGAEAARQALIKLHATLE